MAGGGYPPPAMLVRPYLVSLAPARQAQALISELTIPGAAGRTQWPPAEAPSHLNHSDSMQYGKYTLVNSKVTLILLYSQAKHCIAGSVLGSSCVGPRAFLSSAHTVLSVFSKQSKLQQNYFWT